jgi:predicted glycogen debranching enzyme
MPPHTTLEPPAKSLLYTVETYRELEPYLHYEWLLTNGLGGFSSSTIVGCNTRRYHGLLCAATLPPVGRIMALSRIGEILVVDGKEDQLLEFSINQFGDEFHPRGDRYLERFEVDDIARWIYEIEGVVVHKEIMMLWHQNALAIRYRVEADKDRKVKLRLLPFAGLRDFHSLRSAQGANFEVTSKANAVAVGDGKYAVHLTADKGSFKENQQWWYRHRYAVEYERGMPDTEDLFSPGEFAVEMTGSGQVTLWVGMETMAVGDWDAERARRPKTGIGRHGAETNKQVEAVSPVLHDGPRMQKASLAVEKLARAAHDFVVRRKQPDGTPGHTVIAGYHWFADWGRDTMISLPGLFLVTRRFEHAGQVLSVFAQYVSQGMIPNLFDDYTNEPRYNTVDASLWFIHAAFEFVRLSGDKETFEKRLKPACRAIIDGYRKGTRYHIHMDPADSLIYAGDAKTQLTWMDAKCGDIAFTPRAGKAVEINALWYNALVLMGEDELAKKVAASFQKNFWINPFRGCYDVFGDVEKPGFKDAQLRPNQIFAVSLPNSPLALEQRKAVVEVVRRELLTPFGLRTLARHEPRYHGGYRGDQFQRDQAYHNGAVWPWLMGPFLEAYLRVNDRSGEAVEQAKVWLQPLIDLLERGCVGQLPEICEGNEPHRPVGCCAQAWSVAEVMRLAVEIGI